MLCSSPHPYVVDGRGEEFVKAKFPWRSLIVLAVAINAAVFAYRPSLLPQFGLVLSLPVVLTAAVLQGLRSKGRRRDGIVAVVAFLAAIPLGVLAGRRLRDVDFHYRRLPRYQAIVDRIQQGEIVVSEDPTSLTIDKDLANVGFARRTTTGILRVEFFWGGAFPVKHTAYIYTSTGGSSDGAWNRWRYRALGGNWFAASD
jgi:hypothetical protein